MKGSVNLKPIYTPVTYVSKYDRYLNRIIAISLDEFKKRYNETSIITRDTLLKAFEDSLKKMAFSDNFVEDYFNSLKQCHNKKFDYVMKSAIDVVSVTSRLGRHQIDEAVKSFVDENVSLIKTIGTRLHDQVSEIINLNTTKVDVDRRAIFKQIQSRFGVSKSNAKRIARDQSSKFIANMTEIRHKQVGIYQYRWLGFNDGRERQTHIENNNKLFSYNAPSAVTGNPGDDINCRCVAIGILSQGAANHLKKTLGVL